MSFFSSSITCRLLTALYTSASFFAPVQTSFPDANRRITVLGSGIRWINPGNCSGSYIDFGSCLAASSRWIFPPRFADATMFWIVISASCWMGIPPFFNLLTTSCTAFLDWSSDFAPVQTIFPELKIKVAVFGVFSLKTSPGNWSGWYSTSTKFLVIRLRSTLWLIEADATTFSMLTIALVWGMAGPEFKGVYIVYK